MKLVIPPGQEDRYRDALGIAIAIVNGDSAGGNMLLKDYCASAEGVAGLFAAMTTLFLTALSTVAAQEGVDPEELLRAFALSLK